jgi:hypothetical protein
MPNAAIRAQLPDAGYVRVPIHRLTRADAQRRDVFAARNLDGCQVLPLTEAARYPAPREALAYVRAEVGDALGTLRPGDVVLLDREAARVHGAGSYLLRIDGEVQLRQARRCPKTAGLELLPIGGAPGDAPELIPFPQQSARVQVIGRALALVRQLTAWAFSLAPLAIAA